MPPRSGFGAPSWRGPAALLPLHWGRYSDRYAAGIVLIVSGGIQIQSSTTWTLPLLCLGLLAFITGWSIMPARGWRRVLAIIPTTVAICLLLAGPQLVWILTVPYLCWLSVRHRPPRSYLTVLFVVANGVVIPQFFDEYSGMLPALAISMTVFVGSAWAAAFLASRVRSRVRAPSANGIPIPSNFA